MQGDLFTQKTVHPAVIPENEGQDSIAGKEDMA